MEKEKKITLLPNNIIIQLTFTLTFSKDILCCSPERAVIRNGKGKKNYAVTYQHHHSAHLHPHLQQRYPPLFPGACGYGVTDALKTE